MGERNKGKGLLPVLQTRLRMAIAVMGFVFLTTTLVSSLLVEAPKTAEPTLEFAAWGKEVLHVSEEPGFSLSLIAPANACGLGASSCFKCHNGRRAAEPPADAWHSDHARVNNSCVGCHQGNPRLMREAMAHTNLLADPRSTPDVSCAGCHQNKDEVTAYLTKYLAQ